MATGPREPSIRQVTWYSSARHLDDLAVGPADQGGRLAVAGILVLAEQLDPVGQPGQLDGGGRIRGGRGGAVPTGPEPGWPGSSRSAPVWRVLWVGGPAQVGVPGRAASGGAARQGGRPLLARCTSPSGNAQRTGCAGYPMPWPMAVRRTGTWLTGRYGAHADVEARRRRAARVARVARGDAERFPAGEQLGVLELEVLHRHGGFGGHGASFRDGPPPGQAPRGLPAVRGQPGPSVPPGITVAPGHGSVVRYLTYDLYGHHRTAKPGFSQR